MKIIKKGIALVTITSFFVSVTSAYADFAVTVNKQVNIEKEQKITAKIDGEQKIIEGLLKVTPHMEKANTNIVDISWIAILDQKGRINVSNLVSTIDLDKKFLTRGTSLLVKGNLPSNLKLKTDEEKKEEKSRSLPSNSSNGSSTNISTSPNNPVETPNVAMERPEFITTYDGCEQLYDMNNETIYAQQQTYYLDNEGVKKIVEECHKVKDFPAEKKSCDMYHDFKNGISYKRFQPYFTEENKSYGAGGCVPSREYIHKVDYDTCDVVTSAGIYIKQGQWYYNEDNGEKVYISGCVLDPEGKEENLKIEFLGCPVSHNVNKGQSVHLGKYYLLNVDNSKNYASDCVETRESYFQHQLEWNGDSEWKHNNDEGYSQRVFTRFITIPQEQNRKVVVNNKELDQVKYPHSAVEEGWRYYDDLNRGSPNGHDTKWMRTVVKYGNQQFYTGKDYEEGWYKHTIVTNIRGKQCSVLLWKYKYKDQVRRNDGSEYLTNQYNTGCS